MNKKKLIIMICCAVVVLLAVALALIILLPGRNVVPEVTLPQQTEPQQTEPSGVPEDPTEPSSEEPTEPVIVVPEKVQQLNALHLENPDVVGWVRIDDTNIDYPVMYTPDDPEKYIHMDFYGDYSFAGLPFMEDACSLDPESENLIIYGHNMNNGTMFKHLHKYKDEEFFQEHPLIYYANLEEERTYEIFAVLEDRVYYTYEDVFKFYQFIEIDDEETFNEGISYFKEHSLYDTGITPEYGDQFITLVTCAYHHRYGRIVVVGRLVTQEDTPAE